MNETALLQILSAFVNGTAPRFGSLTISADYSARHMLIMSNP